MDGWRQIAHEAKDLLTVCLAKAIDQPMTAQYGSQWFAAFVQEDLHAKVSNRIAKAGQVSVQDLDLQALLKFLRYRTEMAGQVLHYYGFFAGLDPFSTEQQLRQLNDLLDRLIHDFRNRIEAHSRASDLEKELSGEQMNRIYGYEEAVQDMIKLASIFPTVTDRQNVPYCKRIENLTKQEKRAFPKLAVALSAVILAAGILLGILLFSPNTYKSTPSMVQGVASIQAVEIRYEGSEIVAVCRIFNGTEKEISQLDITDFQLTCEGQLLAQAQFGLLPNAVVAPGSSLDWQFRFPANTVFIPDGDLSQVIPRVWFLYQ